MKKASQNSMIRVLISVIGLMMLLSACEDEISPTLESADPVLVIDAWLTNKPGNQTIKISKTQPYFENSLPSGVSGATVSVKDDQGNNFIFLEGATKGDYVWSPISNEVFGEVGRTYQLQVQIGGETFEATSEMNDVPVIDSLTFTFQEENAFQPDSYLADFWATDLVGPGNTYWIKAWKNGVLLNKPSELNLAYDAGFSAGGNFDGITFITPIRQGVNPFEVDENDKNKILSPYLPGDSLYVEIHSISIAAFNFMTEVGIQTNRPGGFAELFSTPLSNVSTNIFNQNASGSQVVGFFNVGAVASLGKKFEP